MFFGDTMFFAIVGNLMWNLRANNMEEADDAFGKYGLKFVRKLYQNDPSSIVIGKKIITAFLF